MSQENVEIVRSICARLGSRRLTARSGGRTPRSSSSARMVRLPRGADGDPGDGRGLARMARAWDDFHQQADRIPDVDDERVLVLFRVQRARQDERLDLARDAPADRGLFHVPGRQGDAIRPLPRPRARPSKPWGCRSKTLTPTPEPAGYCAGDVAGERGDRASRDRRHGTRATWTLCVSPTPRTSLPGLPRVGRRRARSWAATRSSASGERMRESWDDDAVEMLADYIDAGGPSRRSR